MCVRLRVCVFSPLCACLSSVSSATPLCSCSDYHVWIDLFFSCMTLHGTALYNSIHVQSPPPEIGSLFSPLPQRPKRQNALSQSETCRRGFLGETVPTCSIERAALKSDWILAHPTHQEQRPSPCNMSQVRQTETWEFISNLDGCRGIHRPRAVTFHFFCAAATCDSSDRRFLALATPYRRLHDLIFWRRGSWPGLHSTPFLHLRAPQRKSLFVCPTVFLLSCCRSFRMLAGDASNVAHFPCSGRPNRL